MHLVYIINNLIVIKSNKLLWEQCVPRFLITASKLNNIENTARACNLHTEYYILLLEGYLYICKLYILYKTSSKTQTLS